MLHSVAHGLRQSFTSTRLFFQLWCSAWVSNMRKKLLRQWPNERLRRHVLHQYVSPPLSFLAHRGKVFRRHQLPSVTTTPTLCVKCCIRKVVAPLTMSHPHI